MSDPAELALQKSLYDLWVADANVGALVGDRIYDRVPTGPTFPYVSFGTVQVTDDETCAPSVDVAMDVHVWSRDVGSVECKRILAALRDSLRTNHNARTFSVASWHVPVIRFTDARSFRDPDGLTTHGVLSIECHLDPE